MRWYEVCAWYASGDIWPLSQKLTKDCSWGIRTPTGSRSKKFSTNATIYIYILDILDILYIYIYYTWIYIIYIYIYTLFISTLFWLPMLVQTIWNPIIFVNAKVALDKKETRAANEPECSHVIQTLLWNKLWQQSCAFIPCCHTRVDCGLEYWMEWSAECGSCEEYRINSGVWSVKCKDWSVKCKVWSV